MQTCKKCGKHAIKSRVNYSHGKKSKSTTSLTCKGCGSSDIELNSVNRKYKRL